MSKAYTLVEEAERLFNGYSQELHGDYFLVVAMEFWKIVLYRRFPTAQGWQICCPEGSIVLCKYYDWDYDYQS